MSTTKTAIIAAAQLMCFSLADADELDRLFTETMIELAHDPRKWMQTIINAPTTATDKFTSLSST